MSFALRLSPWFRAWQLPAFDAAARPRDFAGSKRGTAAVEFAIVGPMLILVLSGIFTFGGYFLTAHTVQQLANDAARSAIAGLDDTERLSLVRDTVTQGIASQTYMRGTITNLALTHTGEMITVNVSYDASEDVYWAFAALLPVPKPTISRSATIRLGGY